MLWSRQGRVSGQLRISKLPEDQEDEDQEAEYELALSMPYFSWERKRLLQTF